MKKKFVAAFLAVCMLVTMLVIPANAASNYEDIDGNWAADAIERWTEYGVLNGVTKDGKTNYEPDRTMTRAEFAKVIVSIMGYDTPADPNPFTDIDDSWAKDIILMAKNAGVINGTSPDKFSPQNPVTGEQIALMLCRATGLTASDENDPQVAVTKLVDMGVITADDENLTLGSKVEANRAIVAALTSSLIEEYVPAGEEKTITASTKGIVVVAGGKVTIEGDVEIPGLVVSTNGEAVADENTKIGAVVMTGTEPTADLKGAVDSITITEGTTGAEAVAPKVDSANVTNNSTADATVNDSTVAGVEDKTETPDDTKTDGVTDTTVTGGAANHTHKWVFDATANAELKPEQAAKGHAVMCSVDKCTATQTIPHSYKATYNNEKNHKFVCDCGAVQLNADKTTKVEDHSKVDNGGCVCGHKTTVTGGKKDCAHTTDSSLWNKSTSQSKEATCKDAGVNVFICKECGATKTESTGVVNGDHKFATTYAADKGMKITKEPTCSATGLAVSTCTVCGKLDTTGTYNVTVPVTGKHNMKWVVDTDTTKCIEKCQNEGCSEAGTAQLHEYPAGDGQITTAATCQNPAKTSKVCQRCGAKSAETPVANSQLPHKFDNSKEVNGQTIKHCSVCDLWIQGANDKNIGGTVVTEFGGTAKNCGCPSGDAGCTFEKCVCGKAGACECNGCINNPASDICEKNTTNGEHDYQEKVLEAASCSKAGSKANVCTKCGKEEAGSKATIAKTEHTKGTEFVTIPATCTDKAKKQFKCSKCGELMTGAGNIEEIAGEDNVALDHNWVVTKTATCGAAGEKKCTRCQATETIAASGEHTYTKNKPSNTQLSPATCTENQKMKVGCDVCGTAKADDSTGVEVAGTALGHDYTISTWDGTQHWNVCSHNTSHEGTKQNHTWTGDDENGYTCSGCDATKDTAEGSVSTAPALPSK